MGYIVTFIISMEQRIMNKEEKKKKERLDTLSGY